MVDCPICISTFKKPVCLPCGHIYCKKCITEYVNAPDNLSLTSNCPECRAAFPTTIPDLTYLPEKYHPFISHSLRRVYVDFKADSTLEKKLKDMESRLATKRRAEEALLKRCEALQASLAAHRLGEREAMEHAQDLEERLDDVETEYQHYMDSTKDEISELLQDNQEYRRQLQDMKRELEYSELRRAELEREMSPRHDHDADSDDSCHYGHEKTWDQLVKQRVIKPLPKRRATRSREDDTLSLSTSKRARVNTRSSGGW